MRIFIGPVEVSGIAAGLKGGFDSIGVDASVVLSQPHPFGYELPLERSWVADVWLKLGAPLLASRGSALPRRLGWALWKGWSVVVLLWSLGRFDAFIFLFGNTITNSRLEPRLLSLFGKKVAMVYCGSDARPPYVDGPTCLTPAAPTGAMLGRLAARIAGRVALHEEAGFFCVNNPFTAQFHRRSYLNWFAMGVPRLLSRPSSGAIDAAADVGERPVRILHSPSNPTIKGTREIAAAVERLNANGHPVELVMLSGVPNERVQTELGACDLVADQLYSDTPMAGLAVEAAHHGKPSVVGGYAAVADLAAALPRGWDASLFVHPDSIGAAIERLVLDRALREDLGRRARDFVVREWSPETVAGRYLRLLSGHAPAEWYVAPEALVYVAGAGMPEAEARRSVARTVAAGGPSALGVDHNGRLREAFLAFARGPGEPPQ
jgi:hypothetical protein